MLGAEASATEAPAMASMEAFCLADICTVAGPKAEPLELVARRLALPRFH